MPEVYWIGVLQVNLDLLIKKVKTDGAANFYLNDAVLRGPSGKKRSLFKRDCAKIEMAAFRNGFSVVEVLNTTKPTGRKFMMFRDTGKDPK